MRQRLRGSGRRQRGGDVRRRHARGQRGPGGGQRVGHLVLADHLQRHGVPLPRGGQGEPGAGRVVQRRRRAARTSASSPRPVVTTRATVRGAMPSTRGSSALRTAVPSAGSASTSSPLACAMPSALPNSPRCAEPTLSTTPTCGRATRQSRAMCPRPRAPISSTRKRVRSSALEHGERQPDVVVVGPGRADRRAGRGEHLAEQVLGGGLAGGAGDRQRAQAARPPAGRAPRRPAGRARRRGRRRRRTAARRPDGWSSAATAPAAAAAARKSCPSTRSPATATNRSPAATVRESRVTAPVTAASAGAGQLAAGQLGHLGQASARSCRRSRSAARTSRRTARSSKGCTVPATSWPVSWPLPATSRVSPGPASATAAAMRVAPVADLEHLGAVGRRGRRPRRPASPRGWRRGPRSAGCRRSRPGHRCRRPQRYPSRAACRDRGRRRSRAR